MSKHSDFEVLLENCDLVENLILQLLVLLLEVLPGRFFVEWDLIITLILLLHDDSSLSSFGVHH